MNAKFEGGLEDLHISAYIPETEIKLFDINIWDIPSIEINGLSSEMSSYDTELAYKEMPEVSNISNFGKNKSVFSYFKSHHLNGRPDKPLHSKNLIEAYLESHSSEKISETPEHSKNLIDAYLESHSSEKILETPEHSKNLIDAYLESHPVSKISETTQPSKNLIEAYLESHPKEERLNDSDMKREIAAELSNISELKYENWIKLDEGKRLEVLKEIEQKQAEIEHRPSYTIELEYMPINAFGYADSINKRIVINHNHILSNNPYFHREAIATIIHEGRHAYQHYNVDVRNIHESEAEVESWRKNFYDPEYGYYKSQNSIIYIPMKDGTIKTMPDSRLYDFQPVETDAENYCLDLVHKLEKNGIFGPINKDI